MTSLLVALTQVYKNLNLGRKRLLLPNNFAQAEAVVPDLPEFKSEKVEENELTKRTHDFSPTLGSADSI